MGCSPVRFKSLSVNIHKLCFNCLRAGHVAKDCGLMRTCQSMDTTNVTQNSCIQFSEHPNSRLINQRHHQSTSSLPHEGRHLTCMSTSVSLGIGAGATAPPVVPVVITNPVSHCCVSTYALLHSGSTSSFIVRNMVLKIGLPEESRSLTLSMIEGTMHIETTIVNIEVAYVDRQTTIQMSNVCTKERLPVNARCLDTMEDVSHWPH